MNRNPKTIDREMLAVHALELIKANNITQLLVTEDNKYFGMIHLHDLLQEGII
jgi:arabinose-5-phosphate isomerase